MKSFKWFKEKTLTGQLIPPSREGMSLIYLPIEGALLMFGGISNSRLNDLYLFDLRLNQWKTVQTTGRQPSQRCYHTMFYEDGYVFLYGGQGEKGRSLGDFYFLNTKNWVWKRLFLLESPPFRHSQTINESGDKEKVIFGGICLPENILLNDVWTFNYGNLAFNSTLPEIPGATCTLRKTKGEAPSARKGHCAITYNKSLHIFGGKSAIANEQTFQIHILNLESNVWKKVQAIGKAPTPRSYFSANIFSENRLILFGGLDNSTNKPLNETFLLYLEDLYWSAPFIAGSQPTPRYHHGSSLISLENKQNLVILGGLENAICSMSLHILGECETNGSGEWEKIREKSRQEESACEIAGNMVIDNKKYINELEQVIMEEKMKGAEFEKYKKEFEKKMEEKKKANEDKVRRRKEEEEETEEEKRRLMGAIENMFLMIKQEQMISKEISLKNKLLENTMQNVQEFMINLDQFANALTKSQFDESDPKEASLKKLIDASKDEVNKAREEHKESLYKLKKAYEKINTCSQKNEISLELSKKDVLNYNKEYEQILLETEIDEA